LTYPINSYIIFRRRGELVGGTHPELAAVVSACGRDPPGGGDFLKKDLVCKFLGHSPSRRFISAMTYTLHVRARCSIGTPIPGPAYPKGNSLFGYRYLAYKQDQGSAPQRRRPQGRRCDVGSLPESL